MTWVGLRHKGVEVLTPWEWNLVVDALDILKQYADESVKLSDLPSLPSDVAPAEDNRYQLGYSGRAWRDIYAHYGYFIDDVFVQGRRVLKDGDPVTVMYFEGPAKQAIDDIYSVLIDVDSKVEEVKARLSTLESYVEQVYTYTRRPASLETQRIIVGVDPIPLSEVDMVAKRIHVKVPSWAQYPVYIGGPDRQDFILEPGDREVFEIENPRNIYVRSIGNVEIMIAFEV